MVIVVEPLADDQPGQPLIVGRPVVERSAAPPVTERIDRASTEEVVRGVDGGGDEGQLPSDNQHQEPEPQAEADQGVVKSMWSQRSPGMSRAYLAVVVGSRAALR